MPDDLVLLIAGFVLTTVVGGILGVYFQHSAWAHRYKVERGDERRQQAIRTFEEISTLMDRRLYRMRRLWWLVKRSIDQGSRARDLNLVLNEYREVLFDWNDNLNRLLALVQTYFGSGIRQQLEGVFDEFAAIGRALDYGVKEVSSSQGSAQEIPRVGGRLTDLSHRIYRLNLRMLELFDSGLLGYEAPATPADRGSAAPLAFGAEGTAVKDLQRSLARAGYEVTADGAFGPDTHSAVTSFQRDHNLTASGIVAPEKVFEIGDVAPPSS